MLSLTHEQKKITFNNLILREAGLDFDSSGSLTDQDSLTTFLFKGKPIKSSAIYGEIEYNPYDNLKLMKCIFEFFMNKIKEEDGMEITTYFLTNTSMNSEGKLIANAGEDKIETTVYTKDCLKYGEAILLLNNESNNTYLGDLDEIDS